MPNNHQREYLVIVEVEQMGFVVGFKRKYWDAVTLAKSILAIRDVFGWNEADKLQNQLISSGYKPYSIKGNQLYFEKFVWVTTDGQCSVCLVKTYSNKFCLQTFIRERENHSIIFDKEVRWNKATKEFFDKFSEPSLIAN